MGVHAETYHRKRRNSLPHDLKIPHISNAHWAEKVDHYRVERKKRKAPPSFLKSALHSIVSVISHPVRALSSLVHHKESSPQFHETGIPMFHSDHKKQVSPLVAHEVVSRLPSPMPPATVARTLRHHKRRYHVHREDSDNESNSSNDSLGSSSTWHHEESALRAPSPNPMYQTPSAVVIKVSPSLAQPKGRRKKGHRHDVSDPHDLMSTSPHVQADHHRYEHDARSVVPKFGFDAPVSPTTLSTAQTAAPPAYLSPSVPVAFSAGTERDPKEHFDLHVSKKRGVFLDEIYSDEEEGEDDAAPSPFAMGSYADRDELDEDAGADLPII